MSSPVVFGQTTTGCRVRQLRTPSVVEGNIVWRRGLSHFQDPLVYLLLAAITIALTAWVIDGRVGWPVDALVIAAIVVLNAVLGFVQETKAQTAVAARWSRPSA